jgi:hypothetical protein
MAERPSPGAVLQVEFKTSTGGSIPGGSRFFLSYTGGAPSSADLNSLASDVSAAWGTHIAPRVANAEALESVTITDLSSDTANIGSWEGTVNGTNSNGALISSAAALVNHTVARRYRGGRPRTYVRAGTTSDLASENQWNDTFLTEMLTAWEDWIADILASSGIGISLTNIVNVSWYKGFTVFTTPSGRARNIPTLRATPVVDPITSSSVATKIGSQRRRLDI